MLSAGIHPTIISESFQKALDKGIEVLTNMAQPVELSDRETLLNSATTSLNSKVPLIFEPGTSEFCPVRAAVRFLRTPCPSHIWLVLAT